MEREKKEFPGLTSEDKLGLKTSEYKTCRGGLKNVTF